MLCHAAALHAALRHDTKRHARLGRMTPQMTRRPAAPRRLSAVQVRSSGACADESGWGAIATLMECAAAAAALGLGDVHAFEASDKIYRPFGCQASKGNNLVLNKAITAHPCGNHGYDCLCKRTSAQPPPDLVSICGPCTACAIAGYCESGPSHDTEADCPDSNILNHSPVYDEGTDGATWCGDQNYKTCGDSTGASGPPFSCEIPDVNALVEDPESVVCADQTWGCTGAECCVSTGHTQAPHQQAPPRRPTVHHTTTPPHRYTTPHH